MSNYWQPNSDEIAILYKSKCELLDKIRARRGVAYYPDYWVFITTYRSFIYNVLLKQMGPRAAVLGIRITQNDIYVVHDILYMIAEKTNEVWPDSYQKVEQIIDQYKNMSIRGWIKLIYNFTNEIIRSINKQTTCGYELDYSNIVDVLIETANFRWILKTEHTSSICEPIQHYNTDFELSKTRVLSTTPTQIYDNTTKTVLSFIENL
jgi:hypothetical protein